MLLLFRSLLPSTGLVFGRVHGLGWWENSAQGKQGKLQQCRHVCLWRGMLAEEGSGVLQLLAAENEFDLQVQDLGHSIRSMFEGDAETLIDFTLQIGLRSDQSDSIAPSPIQKLIPYLEKDVRRRRLGKAFTSATPIPTSQTSSHSLL